MTPFAQLSELLQDMFSAAELRGCIRRLRNGKALADALPEGRGIALLAGDAVDVLKRRGRVDQELFAALVHCAPARHAEISATARSWGVQEPNRAASAPASTPDAAQASGDMNFNGPVSIVGGQVGTGTMTQVISAPIPSQLVGSVGMAMASPAASLGTTDYSKDDQRVWVLFRCKEGHASWQQLQEFMAFHEWLTDRRELEVGMPIWGVCPSHEPGRQGTDGLIVKIKVSEFRGGSPGDETTSNADVSPVRRGLPQKLELDSATEQPNSTTAEKRRAGAPMPELPRDLIDLLAEEYPDTQSARALWKRAGGSNRQVENISKPGDLWQKLWLRSVRGASVRPAALLRAALAPDELPNNAVLIRHLRSFAPPNSAPPAQRIVAAIEAAPVDMRQEHTLEILAEWEVEDELDAFAAVCPALEGRIPAKRRGELRETLEAIAGEIRAGALTGVVKAGTSAAVKALLAGLAATT